jgi:hypothetical protein
MDEDNIESRLKEVMAQIKNNLQKNYDDQLKDSVRKGQEELINKFINMFPHLESRKTDIIDECLNNKELEETDKIENIVKPQNVEEMIFDEIIHDNEKYYLNTNQGIWNSKGELVGSLIGYFDDDCPNISFFDKKSDLDIKLLPEYMQLSGEK